MADAICTMANAAIIAQAVALLATWTDDDGDGSPLRPYEIDKGIRALSWLLEQCAEGRPLHGCRLTLVSIGHDRLMHIELAAPAGGYLWFSSEGTPCSLVLASGGSNHPDIPMVRWEDTHTIEIGAMPEVARG